MVNGKKHVDYDMKHHPMDDLLRPRAAKKRSVRAWASNSPSLNVLPLRKENLPMPDDLENAFAKPISEAWEELESLDRRVYIAQRGAPLKGNTLPLTWPKVVNILVKEKYLTREQFNAWGGVPALKERYENIRLRMRTLFDAPEEPMDERDFLIRKSEDFGVYDLEPSSRKCLGARTISADGPGTDNTSHGGEDLEDGEEATESEDDHSAYDKSHESAEAMLNESDIEGIEIENLHRDDAYNMFNEYIDVEHDDQAVPQPETAEIHLSDDLSLHASSVAQDDPNVYNDQRSSSVAEPTDQKPEPNKGMAV